MKIQRYIFIAVLLTSSACSLFHETPQKSIFVPQTVGNMKAKIELDSLRKITPKPILARTEFYRDSLLKNYIDTALVYNFDYQIAWERINQQYAHVRRLKGVLLPEISGQIAAGAKRFGEYTIDGVGNYDTQFSENLSQNQRIPDPIVPDYTVGFIATWEIDVWGKLRAQKKSAALRYLSSETGRQFLQTQLISDLAANYYRLIAIDKQIELINENIKLQENALLISEAQKQTGNNNQLAVDILEAEILSAKNDLISLKQLILLEENAFNGLLGSYPQTVIRSSWKNELFSEIDLSISSESLLNRPDIKQSFLNLNASESDLVVVKKAFYPSFVINGGMGLNAFKAGLLFDAPSSLAFNALGGVAAPLLNRRELKAQLFESQSKKREEFIQLEKTINNAFSEVYLILEQRKLITSQIDLKKAQVTVLNRSIENSISLFTSGRANYLEIINAQENHLNAQLQLLDLQQKQQELNIQLYRAIGGGY
jgi:NodT family efflux transporter outer membrane factor (OMF) lipoprotein